MTKPVFNLAVNGYGGEASIVSKDFYDCNLPG